MTHRTVRYAALLFLWSATLLGQVYGPDYPLTQTGYGPTRGGEPHVATNGSGHLVVWIDSRARRGVYAARIDSGGALLDPTGIFISEGPHAAVASMGGDYYVIAGGCAGTAVYRITPGGEVTRLTTIDLASGCDTVRVASNGRSLLLAIRTLGYLIDRDGHYTRLAFDFDPGDAFYPSQADVTADGDDYVVALRPGKNVLKLFRVGANGNKLMETSMPVSDGASHEVSVAASGIVTLAWDDTGTLIVQRLTHDFVPTDRKLVAPAGSFLFWPHVVVTGPDSASMLYSGGVGGKRQEIHVAALSGGHLTNDSVVDAQEGGSFSVTGDIAITPGGTTVVTAGDRGVFMNGSMLVSRAANEQTSPALSRAGDGFVATWIEQRNLMAIRVDEGGRPIGDPVAVADAGSPQFHEAAFDGRDIVILWGDGGSIYARRYTTELQQVDVQALKIAAEALGDVQVISAGSAVLVTWTFHSPTNWNTHRAALIRPYDSSGSLLRFGLPELPFVNGAVAAAWNGSEAMVTWAHLTHPIISSLIPVPTDVMAVRIDANGVVLDPVPVVLAHNDTGFFGPAIATNGGDFFVTWSPSRMATTLGVSVSADLSRIGTPVPVDSRVTFALFPFANGYLLQSDKTLDLIGGPSWPLLTSPNAVATAGFRAVVVYTREMDNPQFGGVNRLFTRGFPPAVRRRPSRSTPSGGH